MSRQRSHALPPTPAAQSHCPVMLSQTLLTDHSALHVHAADQTTTTESRPRHQTEIVHGAHPGAGARITYTRAMSEHRCFRKKRLSTRTMHFRHVTGGIRVSVTQPSTPASMKYRVAIWSSSTFLIPKMPQNTTIFVWQPRWNMISPVTFAGALTIFAGALPPWAPPW